MTDDLPPPGTPLAIRLTKPEGSVTGVLAQADRYETARVVGLVPATLDGSWPPVYDYTNQRVPIPRVNGAGAAELITHGIVELRPERWADVVDSQEDPPHNGLRPGETYFLSDRQPGRLSLVPGRWITKVGTALSTSALRLVRTPPSRDFGALDVVESAWLRSDHMALALAFADGTDAVFVSNTRILSVTTDHFIGPLVGNRPVHFSGLPAPVTVGNEAFGPIEYDKPTAFERTARGANEIAVLIAQSTHGGTLTVRMNAEVPPTTGEFQGHSAWGLFLNPTETLETSRSHGGGWEPIQVTGRVSTIVSDAVRYFCAKDSP